MYSSRERREVRASGWEREREEREKSTFVKYRPYRRLREMNGVQR